MKFATESRDIIVRRYGVTGLPDWSPEHLAELQRAHHLWNRLVEIDRQTNVDFAAITASDPREKAVQVSVDAATAEVERTIAIRLNDRRDSRSRGVSEHVEVDLATAKRELKGFRTELKRVQKELRGLPRNKKKIEALEFERRRLVKEALHQSDVYWANANAVQKGYETARSGVLAKRAMGLPAQLNFHRFNGGTFVNQFTSGGKPLDRFKRDHRDRDILQITGYANYPDGRIESTRIRNGKTETVLRRPPGGERFPITAQINEHRAFPEVEKLRVKETRIVLRENPDYHVLMPDSQRWLWRECRAVITATAPEGSTRIDKPGQEILSVNLGWRRMDEGLRIATITGQDGRVLLFSDSQNADLCLIGNDRLALADRVRELKSQRDTLRDQIAIRLKALPWERAPESIAWGGNLARAPRFGQRSLARLVIEWRGPRETPHPSAAWHPDDLMAFEAWRQQDNKLRSAEEAARRRFFGGRLDQYRRLAKLIAEHATVILTDQVDYAQMKRKPQDADDVLEAPARRLRQLASAGELAQLIRVAATRYGRELIEQAGPSTFVCSSCGHKNKPDHREQLHFTCVECDTVHDQDVNNCRVRLGRYLSGGDNPPAQAPLAAE